MRATDDHHDTEEHDIHYFALHHFDDGRVLVFDRRTDNNTSHLIHGADLTAALVVVRAAIDTELGPPTHRDDVRLEHEQRPVGGGSDGLRQLRDDVRVRAMAFAHQHGKYRYVTWQALNDVLNPPVDGAT